MRWFFKNSYGWFKKINSNKKISETKILNLQENCKKIYMCFEKSTNLYRKKIKKNFFLFYKPFFL